MDFHGNAIIHIIHTGENCSKMLLTTRRDQCCNDLSIAIFKNSANQNGIFAICSLRMLLVH